MAIPELPKDVRDWLAHVFGTANAQVAERLSNLPTVHEESLDMSLIEGLARFSTPKRLGSNWLAHIHAYYEGGRRHFRTWEIADIGIIVLFRRPGAEPIRKLALLQSKRLYPVEEESAERDELGPRYDVFSPAYSSSPLQVFEYPRVFTVDNESRYRALQKGDAQYISIRRYEADTKVPVYYLLYNPLTVPMTATIPAGGDTPPAVACDVGCRVVPSAEMRRIMHRWKKGRSPAFNDVRTKLRTPFNEEETSGGWRLERFVVDEVLRCREGYRSSGPDDLSFFRVISLRAAPIAAAVAIAFDVPGEGPFE